MPLPARRRIVTGVQIVRPPFVPHADSSGGHRPGGFAELKGAQLAWVASKVPSVKTVWGSCTTTNGSPGQWYAFYQGWYSAGAFQDGPYYWNISCGALPTTTTTGPGGTTTTTVAGPPPPSESVCMKKPWTPRC